MDDFEEPESQIFDNAYDRFTKMPSSPESGANIHHDPPFNDIDEGYHAKASEDYAENVVEDTQFDELEVDTQANEDSLDSRIAETQFAALEKDTQAVDEQIGSAISHTSLLPLVNAAAATPSQLAGVPLIKRPELPSIQDAGDGFKFGLAQPRTQNPSKRPLAKSASTVAVERASSMLEPASKLDRQAHAVGTQQLIRENTHLLHSSMTKSPLDTTQPALPITIHEPATSNPETNDRNAITYAEAIREPIDELRVTPRHQNQHRGSCAAGALGVDSAEIGVTMPQSLYDGLSLGAQPTQPGALKNRPGRASHSSRGTIGMIEEQPQSTGPSSPLISAHTAKPVQRNLSRGRQRIKQPFPEATAPEESRRWGTKTTAKLDGADVQHHPEDVRSGTPSNTGRTRLPTRDDDMNDLGNRSHQSSGSLVNNRHGNTAVANQFRPVIDDETNLGTKQQVTVTKSVMSISEGVRSLENGNVMPVITNGENFDFMTSTHGHHRQTNGHTSLANGCQHLSTASDTSQQKDIRLQSLNTDEACTKTGTQSTRGTEQSVCPTGGPTLASGDDLQDPFRLSAAQPPSRAISVAQSRPQSRHSDHPKPVARPLSGHDLIPATPLIPRSSHAAKVKKSGKLNKQNVVGDRPRSPEQQIPTELDALVQLHRQSGNGILESFIERDNIIKSNEAEIQEQTACIISQKVKIEQQAARIKSQELELQALREQMEKDKATLAPKYKKIMEQGTRYAKHANEVVAAQKWLKDMAEDIRKRTDETFKVFAAREETTAKLQTALRSSKEIRLVALNLETVSKEKEELVNINNKLLADEKSYKEKLEALEKELQQLSATHATQSSEKASLETEIEKLKLDAKDAIKHNTLLQQSLNDRLMDLATEKHNTEQLQKNLGEQTTTWGKLLEVVKQIPADTAEILNGDDGSLAKLLKSESTTQEKVEELTSVIKEYVKREPELPPPVVKLIQDIALRLEGEKQLSESNGASLKDAAISIAQELRENLDQLRLDKEVEIRLNSKITELERARESLSTLKIARDTEVENLSRQLEELKRELLDCRSDLSNKNNELASALNAPREDPALRGKISELEKAKAVLEQEVKNTSQEILKVKEDLASARKIASSKEEETRALTEKLNNAQQTVKKFDEDKAQALALKEEAHKKICQDLAKNMESQKATIKLKLESEVNTLELRVKEKTGEIQILMEQLQSLQEAAQDNGNEDSEAEMLAYKEEMMQLLGDWQRLQQDSPGSQDNSKVLNELKSVQDEMADLRLALQFTVADSAQAIQAAVKEQRAIEESLRTFDATQGKMMLEMEQEITLHGLDAPTNPRVAVSRFQQRSDLPTHLRDSTNLAETEDDMLLGNGVVYTPENSIRHASRKASSALNKSPLGANQAAAVAKPSAEATSMNAPLAVISRGPPERQAYPRPSHNLLQQQEFDSRGLRSPRGSNWGTASTRAGNQFDHSPLLGLGSPRGSAKDAGPAGYKSFATRFDQTSPNGPLPTLHAVNHQPNPVSETDLGKEYSDKRVKNNESLIPEVNLAEQTVLAKEIVHPGDEQVGRRPTRSIRSQTNAPTVAEESRSRRHSQQLKSAMRKSTRSNTSLPEPNDAIEAQHAPVRPTRSNSGKSMRPSQTSDRPLDSIRGLVSGKPSSSGDPTGARAVPSLVQGTPHSSHFFDPHQSLLMDAPTRNRSKRAAPAVLESSKLKAPRFRRRPTSSQTTIPDSQ